MHAVVVMLPKVNSGKNLGQFFAPPHTPYGGKHWFLVEYYWKKVAKQIIVYKLPNAYLIACFAYAICLQGTACVESGNRVLI